MPITYEVTVDNNCCTAWRLNGMCHREDGPALEYANGDKYWCLNGEHLTEEQFNARNATCNGGRER